jgi:hypothetical protein
MRELILVQSACMIVPMLAVVVLCLALNCFFSKKKQIRLQFDLTTLVIFVTTLGIVWPIGHWMVSTPNRDGSGSLGMFGFYSMFTVPNQHSPGRQCLAVSQCARTRFSPKVFKITQFFRVENSNNPRENR